MQTNLKGADDWPIMMSPIYIHSFYASPLFFLVFDFISTFAVIDIRRLCEAFMQAINARNGIMFSENIDGSLKKEIR